LSVAEIGPEEAPGRHKDVLPPVLEVEAATECLVSFADEPWVMAHSVFSAPFAPSGAFLGSTKDEGHQSGGSSGFLRHAVGSIHEKFNFWKETFKEDQYVFDIIKHGYKIPVKMTMQERATRYREKNNQSARNELELVRAEVARLVKKGQVIKVKAPPLCVNPLSVAFKINLDGTIKKRFVINISRWVNKFVVLSSFKMASFQDALAQTTKGDF
jgi:hypothetical protein